MSFELLPKQILWYICNFVNFKDVKTLRLANKYLYGAVKIRRIRKIGELKINFEAYQYLESLKVKDHYARTIFLPNLKYIGQKLNISQLKYLTNIKLQNIMCTEFPVATETLHMSFNPQASFHCDLSSLVNLKNLTVVSILMKNIILPPGIENLCEFNCNTTIDDIVGLDKLTTLRFDSKVLTVFPKNLTDLRISAKNIKYDISYLDKLKKLTVSEYKDIKFPDNLESVNILTTSKTVDLSEMKNLKAVFVYKNLVKLPSYEVKKLINIGSW